MKKILSTLIIVLVLGSICSAQQNNPTIQNVRLFDGDSIYENVTITTELGIITKISQNTEIEKYSEKIIDGSGYTLVPGLINAHFHTRTKKHLRTAVKSGVLCVLDMKLNGSIKFSKLKNLSKKPNYPYFYSANLAVTVHNGHAARGKKKTLNSEEKTTEFVENIIAQGADYIKIMLDDGYKRTQPTLTDNMLATTIEVSRANDKLSVAHIARYDDAFKVANLGVSGLAHLWIYDSTQIPEEKLQILKSNDIFIIPTLFVYQKGIELKGWPIDMELLKSEVYRLYQANIPILAGNDPGNNKVNYGNDLIEEIKLLVESGIPEFEALKSATSSPSKEFDLGKIGFIKEGYPADFLLIKGNPMLNIEDLYNMEGIWKNGEYITPHNKR